MTSEQPPRVLVVDDEPLARQQIRSLLAGHPVAAIDECGDGIAAVEAIRGLQPNVVFLDVTMPGTSGFDVVEAIGVDRMPPVVFVTAYHEHALRAFEAHAVDYLVKPVCEERFADAFRRALERDRGRGSGALAGALQALLLELAPKSYRRHFLVRRTDRYVVVAAQDVDHIEAARNYVRLHVGDKAAFFRATFGSLEEQLDPRVFVRIHRGLIANVERIAHLERGPRGELTAVLRGGRQLAVHRRYAGELKARLGGSGSHPGGPGARMATERA